MKMNFSAIVTFFLLGVAVGNASRTPSRDRYIVKLKDDVDVPRFVKSLATGLGTDGMEFDIMRQYEHVFKGFAAKLSTAVVEKLRGMELVKYVERDTVFTINQIPWGLDRIDQLGMTGDNVYNPIGSGNGVVVYVLDTGIMESHDDFEGRANNVHDVTGGDGVDCNGHGTHSAGLIGGATWGVAKNVVVNSVRVFGCSGSGYAADIIAGCDWVAANGSSSSVVSLSFSGSGLPSVDDAVNQLIAAGFVVVTAAGNDLADACNYSPGRTVDSITVAAINDRDEQAYFSNFGSCVDLFAPGENIQSAWIGSNTASRALSGTSVAVPHVAGAAAILLERDGSLTPTEVKSSLADRAIIGAIGNIGADTPNRLLYVGPGEGPNYPPPPPDCSFVITDNNTVITSPNYPSNYDLNERCEWRITAGDGFYVQLDFQDMDIEDHANCDYDSLNIYDGPFANDLTKLATLCGSQNPGVFYSTGADMYLTFITDDEGNSRGFRATATFLEAVDPTFPPATGTCSCEDTCDLDLNTINSPNYPAEYGNGADCDYQFSVPEGYYVNVTFMYFDLESSATCGFDKLVIYDGTDSTGTELATLCGTILPDPVSTAGSDVYLEFTTDGSVTRTGFQATITATDVSTTTQVPPPEDSCGNTFTSPGSLTSPNWPEFYDNGDICGNTIRAPAGNTIRLTFTDFELEGGTNCPYDSVTIYEGDSTSDPVLAGPLCDDVVVPPPVTSSGNVMFVYFQTDNSVQRSGFRAIFEFI